VGAVPARAGRESAAGLAGMAGLAFGAAAMFAAMYATQAILPVLGREFDVSPARSGLTISVLVIAVATGGWLWGPFSDRHGRKRSIVLASGLIVIPTIAAALAPSFGLLLLCRGLQGLCMPGLLTVGVAYVAEVFAPRLGGRAMGYYVAALVAGGLVGRVGVGLVTAAVGWRWAFAVLAVLPAVGAVVMQRLLPEAPPAAVSAGGRRAAIAGQLHNRRLIVPAAGASALFFTFVSVFSFVTFRLETAPFDYGTGVTSLIFLLWVMGAVGPLCGRLADRVGWRRLLAGALVLSLTGVALSLPDALPTLLVAMTCVITAMFAGVTAAQLGVADVAATDRGIAIALYFTFYYAAGALAGFLPGLAWEKWSWPGVAGLVAVVLGAGLAVVATVARRAPVTAAHDLPRRVDPPLV